MVTKLEKEVITSIQKHASLEPVADVTAHFTSIEATLQEKKRYLKDLDEEIWKNCSTEEIEKEVEEASDWEM